MMVKEKGSLASGLVKILASREFKDDTSIAKFNEQQAVAQVSLPELEGLWIAIRDLFGHSCVGRDNLITTLQLQVHYYPEVGNQIAFHLRMISIRRNGRLMALRVMMIRRNNQVHAGPTDSSKPTSSSDTIKKSSDNANKTSSSNDAAKGETNTPRHQSQPFKKKGQSAKAQ